MHNIQADTKALYTEGGKIFVDGMDISLLNSAMHRKQLGVALQENFMYNGTVAESISI